MTWMKGGVAGLKWHGDTSTTRWKWSRVVAFSNEFGISRNMGDKNNKTVIGTPDDRCVALDLRTLYNTLAHTYTNCLSFYWNTSCAIGRATCREALKRSSPPCSLPGVSIWATRKRYSNWLIYWNCWNQTAIHWVSPPKKNKKIFCQFLNGTVS